MLLNIWKAALVVAAVSLLGCSSETPKTTVAATDTETKPAAAGPPEPVSAKTAFYKMYTPAHAWASDLEPISLKSGEVAGVKNADGNAGVWIAVFGSPSKHTARTYTYSVADQLPDISKGVKAAIAEKPWAGPTTEIMTFQTSDFKVDSDAAYKSAAAKAADWLKLKDNAEKPVTLSLGAASRFPAPIWYILFGTNKSGFAALVNASTGEIVAK